MFTKNEVTQKDGWYISYLPNQEGLPSVFNTFTAVSVEQDETAIVKEGAKNDYYILNGDWRKEFDKFDRFEDAYEFFQQHKAERSVWSHT